MDGVLCDELLQEIIQRLPPSSAVAVSLVSKRWLAAFRFSTSTLSLFVPVYNPSPSLSTLLSHFPNLSSLSILSSPFDDEGESCSPPPLATASARATHASPDSLLLAVAASPCAGRLTHLRFAVTTPVSATAFICSAQSFSRLTALHLSSIPVLPLSWLASFPCLKSLSLVSRVKSSEIDEDQETLNLADEDEDVDNRSVRLLPLETLSLSQIRSGDRSISWIWRHCGNLRRLRLRACEGTGDGSSSPFFPLCLADLRELELRACRSIADLVLLRAADRCQSLTSLVLYDGGSSEALHHFISRRSAGLRSIDLRLPLDLHNNHLSAIAAASGESHSPSLSVLRLQSCCLVTGDGLCALAKSAIGDAIEELALVNCDVVEREPGLLLFLGQALRRLRRVDLSYNEALGDKELVAMVAAVAGLVGIKLRGCGGITDAALIWLLKSCSRRLEEIDLSWCRRISARGVESLVSNGGKLRRLTVEKEKLSEATMAVASLRTIQIVS